MPVVTMLFDGLPGAILAKQFGSEGRGRAGRNRAWRKRSAAGGKRSRDSEWSTWLNSTIHFIGEAATDMRRGTDDVRRKQHHIPILLDASLLNHATPVTYPDIDGSQWRRWRMPECVNWPLPRHSTAVWGRDL